MFTIPYLTFSKKQTLAKKKGKIPFPFNTTIRYSSGTTVGIKSKMPRFIERNISTNVIYLRKASEEDKILEAQNERLVYYELIVMDGGARTTSRISVKAIYNGPFIGMKGRAKTSSRIVQFKGNPFLFPPLFPSSSPSLSFSLSPLSLSFFFPFGKALLKPFANHVPVALVNSFVVDVIDGNAWPAAQCCDTCRTACIAINRRSQYLHLVR